MATKRHKAEEIVTKLLQVNEVNAQGKSMAEAIRSIGVTEVTYYRWRAEYGGQNGEWLPTSVFDRPHPGVWGRLRISHRALDPEKSTDFQPVQSHLKEAKLAPEEIVPVDIAFYPHGRIWHAGETYVWAQRTARRGGGVWSAGD